MYNNQYEGFTCYVQLQILKERRKNQGTERSIKIISEKNKI